jgi:predicted nucleic acid-binding protein
LKILFDTSVLVAAIVTSHSRHAQAFGWMKRAKSGEFEALVSSHSMAELYSVLTSLPFKPKISPIHGQRLIEESVQKIFSIVALTPSDYSRVLHSLAEMNLAGGIIYDALLAQTAR